MLYGIHLALKVQALRSAGWKSGTPMPDGTTRYCTNTNGGPLFVYV